MEPLGLIGTDELIAELKRRFTGLVVVADRRIGAKTNDFLVWRSGGLATCLGLLDLARAECLDTYRSIDATEEDS